jgi:hypothetical protein
MSATLEVVNLTCLAEWKTGEWKISVERGDLSQEMVIYLGMARRVTKEIVTETFMGSSCGTKGSKWLNSMMNGTTGSGMEWVWL